MIKQEHCMNLVLQKFPSFQKMWQEHLDWWEGEAPGFSNDMSVFSDYVLELLKVDNNSEEVREIFIFVEYLLNNGEQSVKNATKTCFLENLINATSWKRINALDFVDLLGVKSKKYCQAWDDFTGIKTDGL